MFPTAEKVSSLGKNWHRFCLKCERCHGILSPGGHAEVRPDQGDSPLSRPPTLIDHNFSLGNLPKATSADNIRGYSPDGPHTSQNLGISVMLLAHGFEGGVSDCSCLPPIPSIPSPQWQSDILALTHHYQNSHSAHLHLRPVMKRPVSMSPGPE